MIKRFLHFIVFILGFSCICFVGLYPQTVINKWSNPVNITNLNSPDDEFAPSWNRFENALYYNSIKGNYSKFYKTKLIDSFKFSNAEFLESGLNQPRNNQSYITFTSEDRAYINTFRMGERRPYINIFETILTRAGWSAPMILDSFRYDCNLLHPTVSPDGKLLVFSSDLKSKNGKLDLWIAYMTDNGSWGGFERIDVLNTDGNEITPYFGSNDTLYFASDGQAGPGGYDLFYSVRTPQGFWQKPNPMTELNTASDESDFALLPNKSAVFASNRPGGFGGMDLYYTKLERIEINPMDKSSLDIAIATQVNAIKSINDQTYQLFPIINTIFNDINEIELEGILNSNKHTDSYKTNFDSLYISSLFVIIERMKQYPGANIIINKINYDQEPENTSKINRIANLLKDFFLRNGIDSNYIKFNSLTKRVVVGELSVRPVIIINSDETKIFEPLSIGKNNLTIDPPSIDVFVKIRPKDFLKDWDCLLYFNQFDYDTIKSGNLSEEIFSLNFENYSKKIAKSDSLVLIVHAYNNQSVMFTKEKNFSITHSETKIKDIIKIDGISYEPVLLFIPEDEIDEKSNNYQEFINRIVEGIDFVKRLKIQFFSTTAQSRVISLSNRIRKKILKNNFKLEVEQKEFSPNLPFSKKYVQFAVRVLIER